MKASEGIFTGSMEPSSHQHIAPGGIYLGPAMDRDPLYDLRIKYSFKTGEFAPPEKHDAKAALVHEPALRGVGGHGDVGIVALRKRRPGVGGRLPSCVPKSN